MILRSEQIVKYGDGTMKKLEELGEIPEAVLYPDTQVEVEPDEPTIDLEDYIEDIAKDAVKGCIFVTSLPDVSEADENTIYVLNVFEAEHNITIFDESDDKDQFIGAEKFFLILGQIIVQLYLLAVIIKMVMCGQIIQELELLQ